MKIMRTQPHTPPYRLITKPDKLNNKSPISGSTSQTSDINFQDQHYNSDKADTSILNKNNRTYQSHAVSQLRSQLNTIKSSVAKLIQDEFIKKPSKFQFPQSNQSINDLSKNSQNINTNKQITPLLTKRQQLRCIDSQLFNQLQTLKEDYEKLKQYNKIRDMKQAQATKKQKQLNDQVKAIKNSKEQLIKSNEILQNSLKEVNDRLKQSLNQNAKQADLLTQLTKAKSSNEQKMDELKKSIKTLQQEIYFRKAQNNQLIRIIQSQSTQLKKLKIKLTQNQHNIKNINTNKNIKLSFDTGKRNLSNTQNGKIHILVKRQDMENLQSLNQQYKWQIQEKDKVMAMMLKDIKQMDKQLKVFDHEHQQLIKCRAIIDQQNQDIMKSEIIKRAKKYRYY